eukprot:gnl/TRDRNA2_/TRDRNA2_167920_c0_seq8.p1 gnl/TRDRNA2_/TRDRNA2_167920_c0~~gnl/TRDRNA2_/TRDRNA2_167920_c0_seq8.p1  ORF type:complete len:133 (-),score=3.81 gnl/TRDRNA2_/TRDRNA2_167920_c0_seq8:144-542(-)
MASTLLVASPGLALHLDRCSHPAFRVTVCSSRQVQSRIASLLSTLGLEYVDSLILQLPNPEDHHGDGRLHELSMMAWCAMEDAMQTGMVRHLGISNVVSLRQLRNIYTDATFKPESSIWPYIALERALLTAS